MKLKLSSIFAIIVLLIVSSCMQDHPNPLDVKKEIKVNALINGAANSGIETRASNNSWEKNDAIGIFMKKSGAILTTPSLSSNKKYITLDGSANFSPAPLNEIFFPSHDEKVDFIAYYPHSEKLDGLNYPVDITDQNNLAKIDLMYADNIKGIDSSTENVNLTFKHQLCNIVINITTEANGPDLTGLKAEITNAPSKASFSLVDGSFSNISDYINISFNMNTDGTSAQAILLPTASFTNQILVLTLGMSIYSYNLNENILIESFDQSTKYTLEVTLEEDEVTLKGISAKIDDWITGPTENITAKKESSQNSTDNPPEVLPEEDTNEGSGAEGDGTQENPYTVEQAQQKLGEKGKWVKGFIVGYYKGSKKGTFVNDTLDARSFNIAIAASPLEDEPTMTFQIDLLNKVHENIKDNIDLKNNPKNFLKKIILFGDIESYVEETMFKNVKRALVEGKQYGEK